MKTWAISSDALVVWSDVERRWYPMRHLHPQATFFLFKNTWNEILLTHDRMCEEVQHPATQVPKAMVGTIILNTVAGLFFLIPIVFVLPDQAMLAALASGQPIPIIIKNAVGSPGGAIGLLFPLLVLGLFCGIGCTTAASRCTWAFARDGAIPGFKWWKQVNAKLDVPLNAMMLSMVVQLILGLIYFGSTAAYNAFSGVGVICLTLSYGCPIAASLIGGRKHIKEGSFHLGALGYFCNIVALGKKTFTLVTNFSITNMIRSLDRSCDPTVLHAACHSRCSRVHELRFCRLLRLLPHRNHLVLCLGQEELPRSAYARGCDSRSTEGKRDQPRGQVTLWRGRMRLGHS